MSTIKFTRIPNSNAYLIPLKGVSKKNEAILRTLPACTDSTKSDDSLVFFYNIEVTAITIADERYSLTFDAEAQKAMDFKLKIKDKLASAPNAEVKAIMHQAIADQLLGDLFD